MNFSRRAFEGGPVSCRAVRIRRSIAALSFATVVILFGLTDCSNQSVPVPVSREPITPLRSSSPAALQVSSAEVSGAIQALIDGRNPAFGALTHAEQSELNRLYQAGGYSLLWLDAAGRRNRDARDALALIKGAADEGFDPSDCHKGQLDRLTATLEAELPPSALDLASFDVALSSGTLRCLRHLHMGRVDPRTIGLRLSVPADQHDFAALLRSALADHRITETGADLRPPLAQYRALRAMGTRYRALAADAALELPQPATAAVRPGEPYGALGILYRQLVAFGDLPAGTPAPTESARYEGTFVDGVKRDRKSTRLNSSHRL